MQLQRMPAPNKGSLSPLMSQMSKEHNDKTLEKLMELEGECKIIDSLFLRFSIAKTVLLAIPCMLTIVGLFLLKYSFILRSKLFYSTVDTIQQCTHLYLLGTDGIEQIVKLRDVVYASKLIQVFKFKQLTYKVWNTKLIPVDLELHEELERYRTKEFQNNGLKSAEAAARKYYFGTNEHKVEIPSYPAYLFDTMTGLFFLLQYFITVILIAEGVVIFGVMMVVFSFLTTTVNYIILYRTFLTIKQTAEKSFPVKILRDGELFHTTNKQLVPGDLYQPCEEIPCDSIVLVGEMLVNEVSMTGQNVPIGKFQLENYTKLYQSQHQIYEGSKLLLIKPNTWALAIHTGFTSTKGRILRKILTRVSKHPQIIITLIYFMIEVFFVACIFYGASFPQLLKIEIDNTMILFRFFDFLNYSIPAALPIYFNLCYSFSLLRLKQDNIMGNEPQKTVEGARLQTVYFDKTGTLTESEVKVSKIIAITSQKSNQQVTESFEGFPTLRMFFAACHSVQMIDGQLMGDEIDLQMFKYSNYTIKNSDRAIFEVTDGSETLQVLKINQYESRFQSMSVIVRHCDTKRLFVLAKGATELIHAYSTMKYSEFDSLIKQLSLKGKRSIALSSKEIMQAELDHYLSTQRSNFIKDTTILAVVAFENKLKEDAFEVIGNLKNAGIQAKVITGDNIYVAVQMAIEASLVDSDEQVIIVEGKDKITNDVVDDPNFQGYHAKLLSTNQGIITDAALTLRDTDNKILDQYCFAVDNSFLENSSVDADWSKVKIFARISPTNKALIVKKHKEYLEINHRQQKWYSRLFGECRKKVAMIGDGANDLLAIRAADLGIGITNSDAIYGSSFSVTTLLQVCQIIRESKNTERQILQTIYYFSTTFFMKICFTIILTPDVSYFNSPQQLYYNFATSLPIALLISLSKPYEKLTRNLCNSNFMSLENHVIFWGNIAVCISGVLVGYYYYVNSKGFVSDDGIRSFTFKYGFTSETQGCTIVFQMLLVIFIWLVIPVSRGKPWKEPIWKSKLLMLLILLNVIFLIPIYFATNKLGFLDLVPIQPAKAAVLLTIMVVTMIVCTVFNYCIQIMCTKLQEDSWQIK